jgi:hypothetical protein|tara:strand:- start:126 stop:320 length:195 start_codon:yes stop_codon:yes gene_type:complete
MSTTNGKGDSPRNCFTEEFRDNYDEIFGKREYEERANTRTEENGRRPREESHKSKKMVAVTQYH